MSVSREAVAPAGGGRCGSEDAEKGAMPMAQCHLSFSCCCPCSPGDRARPILSSLPGRGDRGSVQLPKPGCRVSDAARAEANTPPCLHVQCHRPGNARLPWDLTLRAPGQVPPRAGGQEGTAHRLRPLQSEATQVRRTTLRPVSRPPKSLRRVTSPQQCLSGRGIVKTM